MRQSVKMLIFLVAILASVGIAAAQSSDLREVSSPFTEEFDYQIGQTLDLNILLNGVNWGFLRIGAGDEEDWTSGKTVKTTFTNQLKNLTDSTLSLSVIILLEDEKGRQLERIRLKKIKVGSGRSIENIQRVKIDGGNLEDTAKVYFFAEVE